MSSQPLFIHENLKIFMKLHIFAAAWKKTDTTVSSSRIHLYCTHSSVSTIGKFKKKSWECAEGKTKGPHLQTCSLEQTLLPLSATAFWEAKGKHSCMVFMAVVIPLVCTFPRGTESLYQS